MNAIDPLHPDRVLGLLQDRHIGAANGATVTLLALELLGNHSLGAERQIRAVILHLRLRGYSICATPRDGYFIASNAGELDETCEFLYHRAMTSLMQISAMRNVALPD
ncbi:hypothetical protein, partial [Pseudonocardia sp. TMWB2A]|uniref:hypothetical protein n=1 Tax=Pseudonocardia sp. TMWB2A TaxID=687430 RepID=UPI00307D50CB